MKEKLIYGFITLGLTALIGVGAFVGLHNKPVKETMAIMAPKKEKKLTAEDISSIIGSSKTYYAVAKNYARNGEGVYYQNSISLDNSVILNRNGMSLALTADLINNNTKTSTWFNIGVALNSGVYKLNAVYNVASGNFYYIYDASAGTFNRNYCAFVFTNARFGYENSNQELHHFTTLFDIYELQEDYYEFADNINYYAPYAQDISSYYVNDATMLEASSNSVKTLLENVRFYSGGYAFDTIRLRYQNAIGTSYLDNNGNRQVWSVNGFASFTWMEYVNSVTNLVVVVNERIYDPWNSGNSSGYNVTKGSKWISKYYQKIQFFDNVSDVTITNISKLNNSAYSGGYSVTNNDIGIGSAFTLIGSAFTAWLPILGVSVIPGITLGTLIFLPLIAGIIILIIWIVKR